MSKERSGREIPLDRALRKGHASFWLDGKKLHGAYALTRMREDAGERESWLLVKEADKYAAADRERDPRRMRSARSGGTLRQIAADEDVGRG